jgi:hypothetical protein
VENARHIESRLAEHNARLTSLEGAFTRLEAKQDHGFASVEAKLDRTPRDGTIDYRLLSIIGAFVATLVGALAFVGMIVAGNLAEKSQRNYENTLRAQERADVVQDREIERNNHIEQRLSYLEGYLQAQKENGHAPRPAMPD